MAYVNVVDVIADDILDAAYPIGSYYMSTVNQYPAIGTWEQLTGTSNYPYFLKGTTATQTSNFGTGGVAQITTEFNHTHTGTIGHTHTITHSHQPPHTQSGTGTAYALAAVSSAYTTHNVACNGSARAYPSTSSSGYYVLSSSAAIGIEEYQNFAPNAAFTTGWTTATYTINTYSRDSYINNIPTYEVVYIYQRVS